MSDLETALRNSAKAGRLNHVSLAFTWDGKWEAAYRGVPHNDHRIVQHSDPVSALLAALTGKKIPEPVKRQASRKKAPVTAPEPEEYEDDLL